MAFAEATTRYANGLNGPSSGAHSVSAPTIVKAVEKEFNLSPGRLQEQRVRKYVAKGKAGKAPEQRGGGKLYPGAVFQAAASQISVSGANGIEMSTKAAVQNIRVAVEGTVFQGKGKGKPSDSSRHMERRLRKEYADVLRPDKRERTESSRYEWQDYATYESWWEGARAFLLEKGYAVDEPEKDATGKVISDITIPPEKRRRIFNLDETELPLDGSKRGGSHGSNNVLINPNVPRPGQKSTKTGGHITGVFMCNAAGEPGPVTVIDNSACQNADDRKVSAEMGMGLPRVQVQWGHAAPNFVAEPVVCATEKGSVDTTTRPFGRGSSTKPCIPSSQTCRRTAIALWPSWMVGLGGSMCQR